MVGQILDDERKKDIAIWALVLAFGGQAVVTGVWAGRLDARIESLTTHLVKLEERIIYLERRRQIGRETD